jgi:nucleotide-binding universal stress UspA family protein
MYRRVLVPLDGSAFAERVLPHALAIARGCGAVVHLVRVIDPDNVREFEADLAGENAHLYLDSVSSGIDPRAGAIVAKVRVGDPAQEILAEARPDDLIAMATHGRGGLERWFLGSVAEAITRHSPVPVLLVRVAPESPDATV